MVCLLDKYNYTCRVSSVLNKNSKDYGKQFMFDNNDETCWNSESGSPQWILMSFENEVFINSFQIQFQGGFAGKECHIEIGNDIKNLKYIEDIFPEDVNSIQNFNLKSRIQCKVLKIVFRNSTDFFGRIIIYKLSLSS